MTIKTPVNVDGDFPCCILDADGFLILETDYAAEIAVALNERATLREACEAAKVLIDRLATATHLVRAEEVNEVEEQLTAALRGTRE